MMTNQKNVHNNEQHHHHYESEEEFWHGVEMLDPEVLAVLGPNDDLKKQKTTIIDNDVVPTHVEAEMQVPVTPHQFRRPWRWFQRKRRFNR
jgi:tmRNA-binding protein